MAISCVKPKVLIADDERLIADTLVLILNQGGFHARAAYSGCEALEVAAEFQPDILVSDLLLGDCNGVDTAMRVRELFPRLRVFLLSGQTSIGEILTRSEARDLHFEVMIKPVHPSELMRRLQGAATPAAAAIRIVA